jgi:selT/selW/selH-like putative selenoprotein
LAEAIKKEFGREVVATQGRSSSFEVTVDGKLIFSKLKEGRFPTDAEILASIK